MEFNINRVLNRLFSKQKENKVKVTGEVAIKVFKNDALIDTFEDKNIVVNQGFEFICQLLGGDSTDSITDIGFGTSNTPAVPTNVALTGQYDKALDGISYPAYNSIQFAFSLGLSENNGVTIEEIGLLNTSGDLFSRRLYTIVKDNTVRVEGTWTISIS